MPVVARDEVGDIRDVRPHCCSVFPDGHLDGLQHAVRDLIGRISRQGKGELAAVAREEAVRLFAPGSVGSAVASLLRSTAHADPGIHRSEGAAR